MLKVFFGAAGLSVEPARRHLTIIEREATNRLAELTAMAEQGLAGSTDFPERQHLSAIALRLHFEQEGAVGAWARWVREQVATWRGVDSFREWEARAALAGPLARAPSHPGARRSERPR